MSFLGIIAYFFSVVDNIPLLDVSIHLLEDISLLPGFVKYKQLGYNIPIDIIFQLLCPLIK